MTTKTSPDHKLLIRVLEKVDQIFDKVIDIDKKTAVLEEWRKYKDRHQEDNEQLTKALDLRVSTLENYKWFLMGGSAMLSAGVIYVVDILRRLKS